MIIKNSKFVTSVANIESLPKSQQNEIVFVGRSNVGKSSMINFLTNNKKLAKTSQLPGRTRLINFFSINDDELFFVDLPGYGYAKAGKQNKEMWANIIEQYLLTSKNIKLIFLLLDIRQSPSIQDKLMFNFLFSHAIPCLIVATKCDKIAKSKVKNNLKMLANEMKVGLENVTAFSVQTLKSKEDLLSKIESYIKN